MVVTVLPPCLFLTAIKLSQKTLSPDPYPLQERGEKSPSPPRGEGLGRGGNKARQYLNLMAVCLFLGTGPAWPPFQRAHDPKG